MTKDRSFTIKKSQQESSQDKIKEIVFLIRKLMQGAELYTKELNKKHSITAAQLNCLLALYENGPLPPSQIARHMMVKSSTVTGVIDRLEQKALVKRQRNSPDRRIINIQLTANGKKMAEVAPPPIQQRVIDGLQRLSNKELDQIILSLAKLTKMLDVQDLEVV
ncbi:MAG: MarR family transcriptional regulator [Desulfobacteraceae bacterium]|jgi:DNA-binding MarR family transcriptional regulator